MKEFCPYRQLDASRKLAEAAGLVSSQREKLQVNVLYLRFPKANEPFLVCC